MLAVQADREAEADGLHEVLLNLWDLLGIGEDDINRQLTSYAMQGPARLQTPMIAQVHILCSPLPTLSRSSLVLPGAAAGPCVSRHVPLHADRAALCLSLA